MQKLIYLKNMHLNRTAAILGGGPSLPADVARLPHDCLRFAVNDHAHHIGLTFDYMVMMDDPHIKPALLELAQPGRGYTRVNELLAWTDIDLRGVPRPDARSGIFAAWLALYMGCNPVILCGMDLYQGEQKYCHTADAWMGTKPIFDEPLEAHLKAWRELKKHINTANLCAMSGPLVDVFGGC